MDTTVLVLVVEDDPMLHDLLGEALSDGGFAVAQAFNPHDAMQMIEAPDAGYRALVTDINLAPGQQTGWEIAKRAREINADLPVVYMTGDSGHEWAARGVPNSVLLTKPFAPAQLTTAVAQLLNDVPATT
ncbi:MAG TPA: response regulator [Bradyrhizobium sp.]|nr:response regulator [Bradyrhizobium sp.]